MRHSNKVSFLFGINFLQVLLGLGVFLVTAFLCLGDAQSEKEIQRLVLTRGLSIPSYMVLIDWIPACFLFVIGITLSLQHRNKEVSSEKIRMNSLRKGFLFLAIGLIFSPMWSMDIFIILGVSYIIGSMIFQWEMMLLNVVVIALLFLGLVLINLDVRVFYHYSLLDLQDRKSVV